MILLRGKCFYGDQINGNQMRGKVWTEREMHKALVGKLDTKHHVEDLEVDGE
jgi:hypothetical protein